MLILAIESSCDETAAAVVRMSENEREILSNAVATQIETHALWCPKLQAGRILRR